jgi:hypothetical protein
MTRALLVLGWVVVLAAPAFAHEKGVIRLGSESIGAGGELEVRGEKLPKNAVVRLELRGTLETFTLGNFRTDAAGAFRDRLTLPAEAGAGAYAVVALAPDGDEVARADLVIVPALTPVENGHAGMAHGLGETAGSQATKEMMDLPVATSIMEWVVILGLLALSCAAGLALLGGASRFRQEPAHLDSDET